MLLIGKPSAGKTTVALLLLLHLTSRYGGAVSVDQGSLREKSGENMGGETLTITDLINRLKEGNILQPTKDGIAYKLAVNLKVRTGGILRREKTVTLSLLDSPGEVFNRAIDKARHVLMDKMSLEEYLKFIFSSSSKEEILEIEKLAGVLFPTASSSKEEHQGAESGNNVADQREPHRIKKLGEAVLGADVCMPVVDIQSLAEKDKGSELYSYVSGVQDFVKIASKIYGGCKRNIVVFTHFDKVLDDREVARFIRKLPLDVKIDLNHLDPNYGDYGKIAELIANYTLNWELVGKTTYAISFVKESKESKKDQKKKFEICIDQKGRYLIYPVYEYDRIARVILGELGVKLPNPEPLPETCRSQAVSGHKSSPSQDLDIGVMIEDLTNRANQGGS